ncbi:MAG: SDR family NAD(P)-dependent oxidoreductase, partial [Planctomycetota bacterium]|nr:SDR family NAD(P)-dependent oxidoreductase [Planctomycetota bacterium]
MKANIPKSSVVLVTGASTGIGNHACTSLAERGFTVYAGVRKQQDYESWQ